MSAGYKCDLTGTINPGVGIKVFFVDLGKIRLRIVPQVKLEKVYDQGDICPEVQKKIEAALKSAFNVVDPPAPEKPKGSK